VGAEEEDEHEHAWEWAGAFDLIEDGNYTFNLEQVNGEYAADTALISVHSITEASHDGIEGAEESIESLWDNNETIPYDANDGIDPGSVYLVTMSGSETNVYLNIPSGGAYVIIFEHDPSEFESSTHYLQDPEGEDVDPVATEPEAGDGECAGHWHDGVCHDDDDDDDCPAPGHWHDGECHDDDPFNGAFLLELPAVLSLVPMLTFVW
jgi:hypothetical protein